ncbi:MAG: ferritin-like domain-containing protein [Bacteroidota bacterium]
MDTNEKLIEMLNDLIKINHDRTEGYRRATDELKPAEVDLKAIFTDMANSSVKSASELSAEVIRLGGKPQDDSTMPGKVYRVWMEIRSTLSARDRKSILSMCEFGEDAALKAYKEALSADVPMTENIRQIITSQRAALQTSHDLIKKYRDEHQAVSH